MSRRGFTLIEMLVVVIIIGALIAIGLPQYYKTVYRSRNVQLKNAVTAVASAQRSYNLKHGKYAANFVDLEVSMPGFSHEKSVCNLATEGGIGSVLQSEDFAIVLNTNNINTNLLIIALYTDSPYKCSGMVMQLKGDIIESDKLY